MGERICPECGNTEWSIDLNCIEANDIPYTCQRCGHTEQVDTNTVFFYATEHAEYFEK
jgi:hypothetical protein